MLRGREWTVVRCTPYSNCAALRLDGGPGSGSQTFLLPFDRPRRIPHGQVVVLRPRAWLHVFAQLLLGERAYGGLTEWPASLDLLSYQLEPALAMLRHGHARLLVADDVGLGKTIESGLILRELSHASGDFRALILTPAGLRQQWRDELRARFALETADADADWLRTMGRCLPPDVNPWSPPGLYVASFDFVKRPEALRPLEDVRWDLLVVDEAHAASHATDRRAAIQGIAGRSRRIVLLTATPPADRIQFDALCRIGASPGDPDIVLFQRQSAADERPIRRTILLSVRLSKEERRLHRLLERYSRLVWREARRSGNSRTVLLTTTLRKRALSSIMSLEASLRRRRALQAALASPLELQLLLPLFGQDDAREDAVDDDLLLAAGLSDADEERRWLDALLTESATASAHDSKLRVLVRLLTRIRQPALVFTEYRDTLEALQQRLTAAGLSVCALHGGLTHEERRRALEQFTREGKTLLTTDAAGEGLNLQKASRVIVHFELPWNPSRLLQRAGRIDRIGQRDRVHEIALLAADTAESLVLGPLARRAMQWTPGTAGGRMVELFTESRVAELIFEGTAPDPARSPEQGPSYTVLDLSGEARSEAARLEHRSRLLAAVGRVSGHRSVVVSTLRRSSLGAGCVLVFDVTTCAADGRVVSRHSVPVHAALRLPRWPRRHRQVRELVSRVLPALVAATSPFLDDEMQQQQQTVSTRHRETTDRLQHREIGMRRAQESVARQLVQAGLFEPPQRNATPGRAALEFDEASDHPPIGDELRTSAQLRAVLVVTPR
jgi:superfamily II DNA or RNA helicase